MRTDANIMDVKPNFKKYYLLFTMQLCLQKKIEIYLTSLNSANYKCDLVVQVFCVMVSITIIYL